MQRQQKYYTRYFFGTAKVIDGVPFWVARKVFRILPDFHALRAKKYLGYREGNHPSKDRKRSLSYCIAQMSMFFLCFITEMASTLHRPQLVILTFDDSVNDLNRDLYKEIFRHYRVNPNGCPISSTFFVSHEWTDYSQVQNLYASGHEIASHSIS